MGGPSLLARPCALAGNLSGGKNVPKALEHVEPPLTLAAGLRYPRTEAGKSRLRGRLVKLSQTTENGKLCFIVTGKVP